MDLKPSVILGGGADGAGSDGREPCAKLRGAPNVDANVAAIVAPILDVMKRRRAGSTASATSLKWVFVDGFSLEESSCECMIFIVSKDQTTLSTHHCNLMTRRAR
jgi:hypothetical protein